MTSAAPAGWPAAAAGGARSRGRRPGRHRRRLRHGGVERHDLGPGRRAAGIQQQGAGIFLQRLLMPVQPLQHMADLQVDVGIARAAAARPPDRPGGRCPGRRIPSGSGRTGRGSPRRRAAAAGSRHRRRRLRTQACGVPERIGAGEDVIGIGGRVRRIRPRDHIHPMAPAGRGRSCGRIATVRAWLPQAGTLPVELPAGARFKQMREAQVVRSATEAGEWHWPAPAAPPGRPWPGPRRCAAASPRRLTSMLPILP